MRKLKLKGVTFERGKWAKRDLERGEKVQRKHILVSVIFEDDEGYELSWCPRYTELKDIFIHLEALHGATEVFSYILGDGDVEAFEAFMKEEGE